MINGQDNALLGAFFDTILQLFNAGSTGTGSTDGGGVSWDESRALCERISRTGPAPSRLTL